MDLRRDPVETAGWALLGLLLLAVLVGALRLDRSRHPLQGDEATYAMQAVSLARDFDLAYTKVDFDRFVKDWGVRPAGLVLQSRGEGGRLVYGKPPLYALVTAPFARVAPVRGPVVANALLLAAAALLTALSLRHRIGPAAPFWTAAFLFASVSFAYVFWGDADLFLLASTAAGFALVYKGDRRHTREEMPQIYEGEDTVSPRGFLARWAGAGALLAVTVVYRPPCIVLFLPALVAAWQSPRERRGKAVAGLVLGAVLLAGLSAGIQWVAGGDATGYGGQRQGIYERQGYPEVDFPAGGWAEQVKRRGNASWVQADALKPELNLRLAGWNAIYFLIGRNVGILSCFLPVLLGFLAFQPGRGRWAIPVAVALAAGAFLLLRPFNFTGGGALGNRYFLPLYPALWFLAARPGRSAGPPILIVLLAAPFLGPLWLHATEPPVAETGQYKHVSSLAQRWLPYETTQDTAPGRVVSVGGGLAVKLLNHNVWPAGRGLGLRVLGGAPAELLVASPQPLDSLHFHFGSEAPTRLEVDGRELRPLMLGADGSVLFDVPLGSPRAVHPLAWSPYDYHVYILGFRLPSARNEPVDLRIQPSRDLIQRHRED